MSRTYRWRMKLARLVAPEVIMRDQFPSHEVVILYRKGGVNAAIKAATLDLTMSHDLSPLDFDDPQATYPRERKATGTFSGTIAA